MAEISIEFDVEEAIRRIKAKREAFIPAIVTATQKSQKTILLSIRKSIGTESRIPQLLRSWRDFPVEVSPKGVVGVVGSDNKLANLREFGHPGITPGKNPVRSGPRKGQPTKALAIPLPPARTKQLQRAKGGGPFQFGDLDFVPITRGRTTRGIKGSDKVGLLVRKSPGKKRGEAFFLLAKKVKTRPFRDARNAVEENRDFVRVTFVEEILKVLRED